MRINDDLLIRGLHVYGLGQIVDALETAVGQQQTTPLRPIQHFRGLQIGRQQEHAFAFVAVTIRLHVEGAVGELVNGLDVLILAQSQHVFQRLPFAGRAIDDKLAAIRIIGHIHVLAEIPHSAQITT